MSVQHHGPRQCRFSMDFRFRGKSFPAMPGMTEITITGFLMIRFLNVSLMRGTKPLLEDADLTLNPGDKIGLIGANGAGKSSLFAMLRSELHPDQGAIDFPQ